MKKPAMRTFPRRRHPANRQSGIALIISLICLLVLSTLAAGLIISSQLEIWTSSNYRYVTQARYVAEAGAQQAINWFQLHWVAPSTLSSTGQFNIGTFPTQYVGGGSNQNIIFASDNMAVADTYKIFDATTDTSFRTSLNNVSILLPSNANFTGTYKVAAQLLTARQVSGSWLTSWKIFSQGNVSGATVQVVEVVKDVMTTGSGTSTAPSFNYAILATSTACNAVVMTGASGRTDSYNSQASGNVGNSSPTTLGSGGNVGSNGNISLSGGAKIIGSVYSPQYNTGAAGTYGISNSAGNGMNAGAACSTSTGGTDYAVNEDNSGSQVGCTTAGSTTTCPDADSGYYSLPATYDQRTYALPSAYASMPNALMPSVTANTAACSGYNGVCAGGSGGGSGCTITVPPSTLPSGAAGTGAANFGVVTFAACAVVTLQAGIYNMDTLNITSGAQVILPASGNVVLNLFNASGSATPINLTGGTIANNGGTPNSLTFIYNGTDGVNLGAGAAMFATVYAPNAPVTLSGNFATYGAIVGASYNFSGSGHVVYDSSLASSATHVPIPVTSVASSLHIDQFSWSAY
jgi:Tfp pilus assembly protein PilX